MVFSYFTFDKHVKSFLDKKYSTHVNPVLPADKEKLFFSLPFFGNQSEKLKYELHHILTKHFSRVDFKIILVNKFRIGNFFNYKDKLPVELRNSVVYKYCCAKCASSYIGSTVRNLKTRVAEHIGRSCRTGLLFTRPSHSNVRSHAENCNVLVKSSDFKVVGSASNVLDLRILESLHIFKSKPPLNDMQSSYPLAIVNR